MVMGQRKAAKVTVSFFKFSSLGVEMRHLVGHSKYPIGGAQGPDAVTWKVILKSVTYAFPEEFTKISSTWSDTVCAWQNFESWHFCLLNAICVESSTFELLVLWNFPVVLDEKNCISYMVKAITCMDSSDQLFPLLFFKKMVVYVSAGTHLLHWKQVLYLTDSFLAPKEGLSIILFSRKWRKQP